MIAVIHPGFELHLIWCLTYCNRNFIQRSCYSWTWSRSGCIIKPRLHIMFHVNIMIVNSVLVISFLFQVIATGISTWLVDKSGRRLLLIVSMKQNSFICNHFLISIILKMVMKFNKIWDLLSLLQISSSVMTVSLLIVSIAFYLEVGNSNGNILIQFQKISYNFN